MKRKTRRVLIVGAKFGEIYLNAFLQAPEQLQLVGLLARSSARAQQLAHSFGIALYSAVEQLPDDIDIACVVVRSTVVGGLGTTLAQALLERGIHVIQEHPLHPDDIVHLQQVADAQGCCYWVNSFYPHTTAGRCWIASARRVQTWLDGMPACFAHLSTSRQLLYSSLDLLLQANNMVDSAEPELLAVEDDAFHLLRIALPGCQALLRLQTYLDPAQPDLHSLTMHQMTLGWPAGYLTLEASYGPVSWSAALHDAHAQDVTQSLYRSSTSASHLEQAPLLTLCQTPLSWRQALEIDGPAGVARVLQMLCRQLDGEALAPAFDTGYQYRLARLWQQTLQQVGPAQNRSLAAPSLLPADCLCGQDAL